MQRFRALFPQSLPIVGMIHVPPLPGSPLFAARYVSPSQKGPSVIDALLAYCRRDAQALLSAGVDALLIENANDTPYTNANKSQLGPETTAYMASIAFALRQLTNEHGASNPSRRSLPIGIQILAGANREALSVAAAANCQFIRAEGFLYGAIADEGYMDASAPSLMRFREWIRASHVLVFADIKKKHSSHAITADVTDEDMIEAARFFHADGVIISGKFTGQPVSVERLNRLAGAQPVPGDVPAGLSSSAQRGQAPDAGSRLPILIGSGVSPENIHNYAHADALIVGSCFRRSGSMDEPVVYERVVELVRARDAVVEKQIVK